MSPRASVPVSAHTRNPAVRSSPRPPTLPAVAGAALRVLYQHRVASTAQLHQLLTPDAADASYLRRALRAAAAAELVDAVPLGSAGHRAWHLTAAGYASVEASGEVEIRAHRMTSALAAGPLLAHRLAVVDVGAAFVAAARMRPGDVCTPWSWAPEVLLQPGRRGGGVLIADAVLHYEQAVRDGEAIASHVWLVEVDRGTYPAPRLAAKVAAYARWWASSDRQPVYRDARLLVVVAMAPDAATRRCVLLGHHARALPMLARTMLRVAAVEYDQLAAPGPWAPVFGDVLNEERPLTGAALDW